MNHGDKIKLVKQASKLYTMGLVLERHREKLKKLVDKKVPFDSAEMRKALEVFQTLEHEWKCLEQAHLQEKQRLGSE